MPDGDELVREGETGFDCYVHPLGLGTWHLVAVTRVRGFLASDDDESLYQYLKSAASQVTTPVIRGWAGWLRERLKSRSRMGGGFMQACHGFGCRAAMVYADTRELDELVGWGLRARHLTMNG